MNCEIIYPPGAGSIPWHVDLQCNAKPLCYICQLFNSFHTYTKDILHLQSEWCQQYQSLYKFKSVAGLSRYHKSVNKTKYLCKMSNPVMRSNYIQIVNFKAKGSNYPSFIYTDRSFGFEADEVYSNQRGWFVYVQEYCRVLSIAVQIVQNDRVGRYCFCAVWLRFWANKNTSANDVIHILQNNENGCLLIRQEHMYSQRDFFDGDAMEIRWRHDGDTREIRWKHDGDTMETRWKHDGDTRETWWRHDGDTM